MLKHFVECSKTNALDTCIENVAKNWRPSFEVYAVVRGQITG